MSNLFVEKAENWLYECAFDGLAHSLDAKSEKWLKPYPEVTGYLLEYLCLNNYNEKKLNKIAKTLLKYQNKNGGFPSFCDKSTLFAFDTSQILIGFCEFFNKTGDKKYYNAAIKAGDFLMNCQLDNGAFVPIYNTKSNQYIINQETYKTWNGPFSGLMCKLTEGYNALYKMTNDNKYKERIGLTISFYKTQKDIEHTHPMGYFLEGLYAGGEEKIVKNKLEKLILPRIRDNGYIPYCENLPYAYVSGTIQLGIMLFKTGFVDEAKKILNYARLVQSKHPSGGLYQYADKNGELDSHVHTEINSWGTKYFCQLERLLENV